MAPISLKIISNDGAVTRKMKFDLKSTVRDAHDLLKEKVIVPDQTKEHGLFLRSPDDDRTGIWLENHRTLDFYMLRDGDSLDYICKIRNLRIKLLDGTVKTIQVNEGKTISELMVSICGRLNIANHDEHGLCPEEEEPTEDVKEAPQTGTLRIKRRKAVPRERDAALEQLSKKINTDDNVHWLDQHSTLRELGVAPTATLVLKRRLFFSDRNVDARDPVQLTLLYAQTRDAILAGRHLVTEEQAVEFAGIQCQIHYEDFQEEKHKPGFIVNLNEFLPVTYSGSWGIEKKVLRAYRKHAGLSPLEAKNLYIKTARDLPTYGVTFFLVKEKQKGKKKLVPRLLGINAQAILRMDEVTKEILQQWPLTHVKNYHVGKAETFTLNFGDYSDKEYCCKTQDVHRIREILEGYIDLIRRRMLAKPTGDTGDSMAICHDMVETGQSNIIQHVQNQASKLISETFVGPSRIMPHDQGSTAQRGTQVMTMQQIIASNQFNNPQKAIKGEVAQRGDMSLNCVRKLKRMNSGSVKIVTLLAEPTEANISDTQQLTKNMQDDLVVVEMGVKEIAQQQTIEESRQMLLNEMQDLNNYMNKLSDAVTPGQVDANEAKDAAEKIVDLTTEMYLAQDPKTKRRSELLNRSKESFKAGEKMDDSIRRASFLTAASSTIGGLERAAAALAEEHRGAPADAARARHAELALQARLGKLNAALALHLTARSDPNNIDYPAAINSMNTIDELLLDLVKEGQLLASTKPPETREELLDDLRALIDKTRDLCALTGVDEHAKMQEASSKYADVAGKLIFKIFRGGNSQKENEIIELAKVAGDKTTLLLMSTNELTAQAPAEPAAALDTAGVKSAAAAMDLLACAQLTAPAIYEPHCRSALTAAVEGVSSSVHQLSAAWKPLVEDPGRQYFSEQLHHREMDVHLALEKLKDAYANLGDLEDESVPLEERQRLKFILSLSGARDNLKGLTSNWGKPGAASPAVEGPAGAGPKGVMMLELKEKAAARRLAQQLAELNGAVARLASATADPKQQDYVTAASALNTIAELMPTVVQDADVASARQDEGTRAAMKQHVARLCEASQHLVDNLSSLDDLGPPAAKFSGACSKLVFLISPGADKGKEQTINEVAAAAYDSNAALLAHAHRVADRRGEDAAALRAAAARAELAARALVTAAQVTAPSVNEASCSSALAAAVQHLQNCINEVTAKCYPDLKPGSKEYEELQKSHKQLENNLERLAQVCGLDLTDQDIEMGEPSDLDAELPPQQENRRLQFIKSMSDAKVRLDEAEQQMKEPLACVMMRAEDAAGLQRRLARRLARLSAAAAALARAAADGENPDYDAAQQAVDTITELMPELVQETCVLGATKSANSQQSMLQQLQRLCRAAHALCDGAPGASLKNASAELSDASGKLVSLVSPGADHGKENEIKALTSEACSRASELLSHVQDLIQKVPEKEGAELDKRGARTTDDAQVLLTTAQLTAPTIADPHCSAALVSAAEQLRGSAQDLTRACQPHLKTGHKEQQGLQDSAQHLENSLDKLVQACKERRKPPAPPQQDKQRLHFINSLSGAKSCFDDAQQLLNKPVVCTMMREEDGVALERRLADRLAQLNAAIAALATATADREHPDYASAQRAVSAITALMPDLARESRTLCGTKTDDAQQHLLQQVQQLCDASRAVCDSAGQPQALSEAAAKFADVSGKLMFTLTPAPGQGRDKQGPEQQQKLQASHETPHRKPPPPPQQDKQRLHFVNSLSGAKSCFDDAQQLLKQPVVCAMMREEDGVALERRLADRLAQLNAAVAALASATVDREHPDYASAQRAINTITTLMPELVRDSKSLCGTKTDDAQQKLLQQVQQLCDASRAVCDSAGQPQALNEAATKFADASGKLMFTFMPAPVQGKEKQIMDLSAESYNRTADLVSQAKALQGQLNPDVTSHLDSCSTRTGDAAQALLAVAQVTAPSMSSPHCQAELDSAVQKLRRSAADLTGVCDPHVKQGSQRQQLLDTHQRLDDSLDKLLQASGVHVVLSPEQQEKRRLTFVNSLAGAKSCFGNVQQQLKQPMVSITLQPEEHRALQLRLSDRLAQLNAAIAKLASATADRERPDYASAQRAVSAITALMPDLVRDAKTLSATQQGPAQQNMLRQVQQLCDASRAVCDSTGTPQGLSEAAVKFSEASSELTSSVGTGATQAAEQQIIDLSVASVGRASELLSQVQALTQQIAGPAATELDRRGASTAEAAQALLTVAQVTAPSISSRQCKAALESAVQKLRGSAADLTTACDPHAKQGPQRQQLLDAHQHLDDSLDMLLEASGVPVVLSPEQQEKRRRTFISSLAGAKSCFEDVQQQLKQPVVSITLQPEEHRALQLRLSDRLAELNAAIAKLTSATADREHPDYASAQRAVSAITALMPDLARDAKTISATQQGPAQQSILQQVQQLCDASRAVCDNTGTPQGLSEAAVKFSEASSELTSSIAPGATQATEQQIIDLSAVSVGRASELLSQVQALTQQIAGPAATELDRRGASTADAAQALLTVAQVTAPSMSSQQCKAALESAVQKLRGSAADLTTACDPHLKQGPQRQQLLVTYQHLDDSLDTLLEASGVPVVLSPEQQEKRRLTFMNSLAGAKNCFGDVQQQLKEPVVSSTLPGEEVRALQRQLGDRLARLNAAVASLAASTADREHPDYASAQRAVSAITALMPDLVRDAKTLSATQQGPAQQSLLRQVQQLCDASRAVCDSAGQPQSLGEAAVKFSEASNKLTSSIAPAGATLVKGGRQQLVDLSAKSCACASELLSQVQVLTQQIAGPAATELDKRGAGTADAAQALLTVAHVTAPSMKSPHCRKVLESAVQRLRGSAADLTTACDPHVKQGPQRQQLLDTHQHLDDSLDLLLQASGAKLSPEKQEMQRQHFISNLSEARNCFADVQQQLKQPAAPSTLQPEELRALQFCLSDKLAQLNAAIAKLTVATADREHPDYASAQRAVSAITALMPDFVRDAKTLSGTQQGPAQQSLLQQVQQLCDASRAMCDGAGQPQDLSKAATQFSEATSHLMSTVSSVDDHGKEKLIMDLSAASCSRASALVAQAQAKRGQLRADVTKQLDTCSARTDGAVQALKAVVQVTASSMSSPECQAALESAVQALRDSASELAGTCDLHLEPGLERQQLLDAQRHLDDSLDLLMQASASGDERSPAPQEALRTKFIRCVSAIGPHVKETEKLLNEPLPRAPPPAQAAALQQQLARRLRHLQAAVAALGAATRDHKYPDYAAAERSIITITELMPKVVRESRTLSCTKSDDCQQTIRQNLKELCNASRQIVDNADNPKKLNELSAKFAFTSGKLVQLVSPDGGDGGKRKAPPVPQRAAPKSDGHSTKTVAHGVPSRNSTISQDFLDAMRAQEDNENAARVVAAETKWGVSSQTDEEKCRRRQFSDTVDTVEDEIKFVEDIIKKQLHSTAPRAADALELVLVEQRAEEALARAGVDVAALVAANSTQRCAELVRVEQRAEEALARAGVDVAALVAANYADKLDYRAAQEPTLGLGRTLRTIVEDGCTISGALPEESRKPFINDLSGLCGATRILCQAARDEKERLNDAAVAFGNHSARLLQAVSAQLNPALEKEVIHRARAIGDCASRLAREATNVANNSANMQDSKSGEHVQSICTAGAQCVDAAGKLVYTAKLVAPTIHHKICQEALTSSADTLSSNLKTFSETWQPFASDPHTQKLTEESRKLARLLATLKADVERGRLGKRREGERPVVVDTPLRQLTVQIIDNARNMAEHGDLPPEAKQEYRKYCSKLTEAVRALDCSNARCQRAPQDKNRRNEMEIAIQDLQMMLLQARPARAGQEQNNIVDFRDFLQGLVTESDNLARAVDRNKAITGKRTADDVKLLCSKISEDSTRLMNPSQSAACDGFDDIMEIDEFGQECDVLARELAALVRGVPEQRARSELLARLFPLTENCSLLRFASSSALATAAAAAHDAALHDLDDFRASFLRALPRRLRGHKEACGAGAGAWGVLRAGLALGAAAGRPPALRRALTSYALHARAATRPRARHAADVTAPRHHAPRAVCEERVIAKTGSETKGALINDNLNEMARVLNNIAIFAEPDACSGHSRVKTAAAERSLTEEEVEQQTIYSCEEVEDTDDKLEELAMYIHLEEIAREVQESTEANALLAANWLKPDRSATVNLIRKVSWNIHETNKDLNAVKSKPAVEVLKEEDIEKLLSCQSPKVEGTRSQLEDKLSRLSSKLSSMGGSVFPSVRAPASAARSLHAAACAAAELAAVARALKDDKKPAQSKRIEDAVHEMCLATFSLMKISELLCQFPDHHDTRRRLLDACYHLNDSINKLNRTIHPEPSVARECSELLGVLQLQRSVLQCAPLPAAASPYAHCVEALQSQRDVLLKLNSDEAMSREQFLRSMLYVTTAVTNSTECAAQAAYLLSVSEKDATVALEGLVDVPKMQKIISAIHDTCVSVTMNTIDQVIEEKRVLEKQIEELLKDLHESVEKTKDQELKTTLVMCRKDIEDSAKSFYRVVNEKKLSDEIISAVLTLDDDVQQLSGALEHPALVPTGRPSPANQALCDDVLKHTRALVSETQELIKDIKNSSEQSEVMKWSSFAKRKDVLSAIDTLMKSIKTNGQNVNILEADLEDSENNSYVQIQTDTAFKWLHKPMAKSDVKANGQQAVKNLIEVGRKMTEDLAGADKEDLRHAVDETEQLLAHCSRKYDQDQYSLLMERIRELQKAIERMAVTRVVEDFMDAEEPLADLDILADAETDATKRKFLLEQKIAELLAQLARVKRTASYIADTGSNGAKVSTELRTCSEQTELLAPLLVKAAEERIHKSDNQMVIDNYRALLAQYTEALAKVRDLCDQSVDPMDFVQTAGETMQRMRDESINQDVMKCAYTSAAITKLANRVIHVGLSSSGARADPDLQRALVGAQRQLSAATPAPDTRASRMPDWKDTTALILRATGEVESVLGGENIFNKQPDTNEPIYNEALNLHVAIRDWSSRDNEIVAVARRMAVLMAKLSSYMHADKQREVLSTSKSIVRESREVARLARKLAHECPDQRIKSNLLQVCDRIPTISGQLKMLTTIKGSSLGHHGTQEDKEAMDMLVGNAQGLMISIQDVVKAAASASVKIMSQRGPRIKWVRRTYY